MRRVLVVAQSFPPGGGGGVMRSLKFVKYLPSLGWRPIVLTVRDPATPESDQDLLHEIPPEARVVATRSFGPSHGRKVALARSAEAGGGLKPRILGGVRTVLDHSLFLVDTDVVWLPAAWPAALSLVRRERPDVVFVTAPPFSSFLLGLALSGWTGVPWVADFRDEWVGFYTEEYSRHRRRFGGGVHRGIERRVLAGASVVTAATRGLETSIGGRHPAHRGKIRVIENGYDDDDLPTPTPPRDGPLTFGFAGSLFGLHSPAPFLDVVRRLRSAGTDIRVVMAGPVAEEVRDILAAPRAEGWLEHHGFLPHREALEMLSSCHLLLHLIADRPGAERIMTGKMYEYAALGRPVLAVVPPGEAADFVLQRELGWVVHPGDAEGLRTRLEELVAAHRAGGVKRPGTRPTDDLSRVRRTGELARVLAEAAA
jgi:glycosyltransferase involved in cell wall biosynthesis